MAEEKIVLDGDTVIKKLDEILRRLKTMTDAMGDLNTAEQNLETEYATESAEVVTVLNDLIAQVQALQSQGVDTAGIEAVVTKLQALTQKETTDTAAAAAADPGPQTPPAS